jgi:hypothetical protein
MYQPSIEPGVYLLTRQIPGKGFEHYGVGIAGHVVPELSVYAPAVVHRLPEGIQLDGWARDGAWAVIGKANDTRAALGRLLQVCRDPTYGLLDNNCEQFARRIVTGRKESRQVQGMLVALALAALFAWFAPRARP